MARRGSAAARRKAEGERPPAPPVTKDVVKKRPVRASAVELDQLIHERARLAIVSALAGARSLTFNELKSLLHLSDGNLSVHTRRLEDAGFVVAEKSFVERLPRTEYRLTPVGRKALDTYLDHMESLIRRVRDG